MTPCLFGFRFHDVHIHIAERRYLQRYESRVASQRCKHAWVWSCMEKGSGKKLSVKFVNSDVKASRAPWPLTPDACVLWKEPGHSAVAMATELLSGRLDSTVITREKWVGDVKEWCWMRGTENEKWWRSEWKVCEEWMWIKGKIKSEQEWVWGKKRESVGRKQLYLHEAYLGSRLQNNGRKRVHGTFPCERACVPLIQGLVAPRRPAVSRDVTLRRVVRGSAEGGRGGAWCTSAHLVIES